MALRGFSEPDEGTPRLTGSRVALRAWVDALPAARLLSFAERLSGNPSFPGGMSLRLADMPLALAGMPLTRAGMPLALAASPLALAASPLALAGMPPALAASPPRGSRMRLPCLTAIAVGSSNAIGTARRAEAAGMGATVALRVQAPREAHCRRLPRGARRGSDACAARRGRDRGHVARRRRRRFARETGPVSAPATLARRLVARATSSAKTRPRAVRTSGLVAAKPRSSKGRLKTHCRTGALGKMQSVTIPKTSSGRRYRALQDGNGRGCTPSGGGGDLRCPGQPVAQDGSFVIHVGDSSGC